MPGKTRVLNVVVFCSGNMVLGVNAWQNESFKCCFLQWQYVAMPGNTSVLDVVSCSGNMVLSGNAWQYACFKCCCFLQWQHGIEWQCLAIQVF